MLLSPFAAFPETGAIDLVGDRSARQAVARASADEGVTIALAYPFVLTQRRGAASFAPALEAAAEIGARGVGLLIYDRDPIRAAEELDTFCSLASSLQLRPALEFFGGSAVPSLAAAERLKAEGAPSSLGLCVDLLHLVRSGGCIDDLPTASGPIVHAQISDALLLPTMERDAEAAHGRLAPGQGDLDILRFVQKLPSDIWLGVEVPPANTGDNHSRRHLSIMIQAREILTNCTGLDCILV